MSKSKNASKSALDARWLAMGLLGIDSNNENPLDNPQTHAPFRRTLQVLTEQISKIINKYEVVGPPVVNDFEKLFDVYSKQRVLKSQVQLSDFFAEVSDRASEALLALVPEYVSLEKYFFSTLPHIHDHLMGIAAHYFPLVGVAVGQAYTPDKQESREKMMAIKASKEALAHVSQIIRTLRGKSWLEQAVEKARSFRIERAFADMATEGAPKGKRLRKTDDRVAIVRTAELNAYKRAWKEHGVTKTNEEIAHDARPTWNDRTPVQRWQRNDPKSTPGDDAAIRRVLQNRPQSK